MCKNFKASSSFERRSGENVVLRLMEYLTPTVSFDMFMGTSFHMRTHLGVNNINDIVTPLRLLELFFEDILVDTVFGYTKLYRETKHLF